MRTYIKTDSKKKSQILVMACRGNVGWKKKERWKDNLFNFTNKIILSKKFK